MDNTRHPERAHDAGTIPAAAAIAAFAGANRDTAAGHDASPAPAFATGGTYAGPLPSFEHDGSPRPVPADTGRTAGRSAALAARRERAMIEAEHAAAGRLAAAVREGTVETVWAEVERRRDRFVIAWTAQRLAVAADRGPVPRHDVTPMHAALESVAADVERGWL